MGVHLLDNSGMIVTTGDSVDINRMSPVVNINSRTEKDRYGHIIT